MDQPKWKRGGFSRTGWPDHNSHLVFWVIQPFENCSNIVICDAEIVGIKIGWNIPRTVLSFGVGKHSKLTWMDLGCVTIGSRFEVEIG